MGKHQKAPLRFTLDLRFLVTAAIVALSITGCAPVMAPVIPVMRWSKPGATQDEFMRDRYACIQDARRRVSSAYVQGGAGYAESGEIISRDVFVPCMGAHGYALDPNGTFVAPPGGVIQLR